MPIIDVDLIGESGAGASLCNELAQAIARRLDAPAGTIWVRLSRRSAADYAENGPPPDPLPVFVRVLARGDDGPAREFQAEVIAAAMASALSRPLDRVHVIFEADARGRVFFGGRQEPR